jgi:hypothetical protein
VGLEEEVGQEAHPRGEEKEAQKESEGQEEAFEARRVSHGSRIKPPTGKKVLWGAVMGLTCRWPS